MPVARREVVSLFRTFFVTLLAGGCVACRPPAPATTCAADPDCPRGYSCHRALQLCVRAGPGDAGVADRAFGDDGAASDRRPDDAAPDATRVDHTVQDLARDRAATDTTADGVVGDGASRLDAQSDADGSVDGGTDGGTDAAAVSCGTTEVIRDEFAGNMPLSQWRVTDGTLALSSQSSGQLRFAAYGGSSVEDRTGYESVFMSRLRGAAVSVQVVGTTLTGDASGTTMGYLEFCTDDTRCYGIGLQRDKFFSYRVEPGSRMPGAPHIFDPGSRNWWRIDALDSAIVFSDSADGVTWGIFDSLPLPADLDLGTVALGLDRLGDPGSTVEIVFDHLNRGASAGWCPASSLRDDFGDAQIAAAWRPPTSGGPCSVVEAAGRLTVEVVSGATADCALESKSAFDIRHSEVSVAIVAAPTTPGVLTGLFLWHPDLLVTFGMLNDGIAYAIAPSSTGGVSGLNHYRGYDALRISHDGTQFQFWTHEAGSWHLWLSPPYAAVVPDGMQLAIGTLDVDAGNALTFSAVLDDLNLTP